MAPGTGKTNNAAVPPFVPIAATTVVVVGGSAGALVALRTILSTLPAELDAAVLIALHTAPKGPGYLAGVLKQRTALQVAYPFGLEPLLNGRVYVAPPDRHLQVTGHCAETTRDALEHHTRPAIDVLFRSAAHDFERRVIAVLLSGNGRDGSAGVVAVHEACGVVIVQSPNDATYSGMPQRALEVGVADYVLPASLIGGKVQSILSTLTAAA